jgi:hypothetical protein
MSSLIQIDNKLMICHRLKMIRTATWNIDQTTRLTRLKCRCMQFFWSDSWCGNYHQENFRSPNSCDQISLTLECDIIRSIVIMCAMAKKNFSIKFSSGSPRIENSLPGRVLSRQEISPVLKLEAHHGIRACEYTFEPSIFLNPFWIFWIPRPLARNHR